MITTHTHIYQMPDKYLFIYSWPDVVDPPPSLNFGDAADAGFDESECIELEIVGGDVEWLSIGTRPSFWRFFCFIRRFWNQIFIYMRTCACVNNLNILKGEKR